MKILVLMIITLVVYGTFSLALAGGSRHSSDSVTFHGNTSSGNSYYYSRSKDSYKSGGYGSIRGVDYFKPIFYSGLGYVAVGAANAFVSGIFAPAPTVAYPQTTVVIERPAVCYETYYTYDHWRNPVAVQRQIPCY